ISVLLVVDTVADALVERITKRIEGLRTGDGRRDVDMGPLVSAAHRDRVLSYIDAGQKEGAEVVADGRDITPDGSDGGYWVGPLCSTASPPAWACTIGSATGRGSAGLS